MKGKWKKAAAYGTAAFTGIAVAILLSASFHIVVIESQSMAPEIGPRDIAVINKWSYFFQSPAVGDLVAFHSNVYSEAGEGDTLIRRVAATEGDSVEIKEGNLYINDKIYNDSFSNSAYMEPMEKIAVGPGKVFVLSDNREALLDSRDQAIGQISRAELIGGVSGKIDRKENE